MGKYALLEKASGNHLPASTRRRLDRAKFMYNEGYPVAVDTDYGWFRDSRPFPAGGRNLTLSASTVMFMKEDAEKENREPRQKTLSFEKKRSKAENIPVGKNGKLFELDEILCIETHDFGMFPGAEHPYLQETIAKNDYDIIKARNELVLYFKNNLWLKISPVIYVKKEDAEKPLRQLAQNASKENRSINPEDFGLVLHPSARWILESVQGDKMQLIWKLEPMLSKLPTGIDWQEAEAVMQFLNAFSINIYFYQLKEMRNSVMQDVLGGRLDAALRAADKMDCARDKGMALCWIIMARLNRGEIEEAAALLKKMVQMPSEKLDWPSKVKATGLVAMYYSKMELAEEAEKCFAPLEKMLEGGFGAGILIEWEARAGLEGSAIQNLLKYANGYETQDKLFGMLGRIKPFEIDPRDFEVR